MISLKHSTACVARLVSLASIATALLLFAGCATDKYGPFEPKEYKEAPEFQGAVPRDYSGGFGHHNGYDKAYEWQQANPKLVADATRRDVLAKFVESDEAADALLAKIGTSYDGDPVALTQIAAVTQLVMCPKCHKAPKCRQLWVAALKRARENADDGYVRTFCDQQLRVCEWHGEDNSRF